MGTRILGHCSWLLKMLIVALGLIPLSLFSSPVLAQGHEGHGGGFQRGGIQRGGPHGGGFGEGNMGNSNQVIRKRTTGPVGRTIFPQYPRTIPRARMGTPGIIKVPSHVDSLGNRVTEDHLHRVDFAHGRSDKVMRKDVQVTNVVRVGRARYVNFYRPAFDHKTVVINDYVHRYNTIVIAHPVYMDVWHRHFFYGGIYWGFHPIIDIDTYFYNPMVYWFYVGSFDEHYYRNWYQDHYDAYPELHEPFQYHGLYYPTENLRQLLFGVSAMSVDKQVRFRQGITTFTQRLAQNMANGLGIHVGLNSGDIVVTHYEVIGYDDAVVLEGLVTFGGNQYNFKGLVDMEAPDQTDVFVPATWDKNPSSEQLARLDSLNEKISALKGEPPQTVSAEPDNTMAAPSPGSVSADPQPKGN